MIDDSEKAIKQRRNKCTAWRVVVFQGRHEILDNVQDRICNGGVLDGEKESHFKEIGLEEKSDKGEIGRLPDLLFVGEKLLRKDACG